MNQPNYILFLCLLSLFACKKDFAEINTNPNAPSEVQAELLLRQIIYNTGEEMSYEGFVAGNLLGQYFTMVDFNLFDRHGLTDPQLGGNPWPVLYTNLRDNEILLSQSRSNPEEAVYEGPSLILKAYLSAMLTDLYGDVPYFEALKGTTGIITPAYDTQQEIYTAPGGILDQLEKGILALQNYSATPPLAGDLLFSGDLNAWITFARSLQIKYLLRISDRVAVADQLAAIYTTDDFIASNQQNATFSFTDERPNSFRMQQLRDGDFNLFILSQTMEEQLKEWNDPRMQVLFRPIGNDPSGMEFNGLLNGPDAAETSISVADYSLPGTIFREHTGDLSANFMTAWETHFLLAEAAEKGWINADPQTHYERAVRLAFAYWYTEIPADYLSTAPTAYGQNGADKIEQIISQKWLANIINGYEGWVEYRRTGFPKLKPVAASLNDGLLPQRMPYPTDEAALNQSNYEQATQTNGNSINAPVWWDVE